MINITILKKNLLFTAYTIVSLTVVIGVSYGLRYFFVDYYSEEDLQHPLRIYGRAFALFISVCVCVLIGNNTNHLFKWTALFLVPVGLMYGLGINSNTSIFAPSGTNWDIRILWYYLTTDLNEFSSNYKIAQVVSYVSIAGLMITGVCGLFTFAVLENLSKEIRSARKHKGTEKYRSQDTVLGDAQFSNWDKIKHIVGARRGIVLGENYNPMKNTKHFNLSDKKTWGEGGKAELITMSTQHEGGHSLIYAGTGGGKTAGVVYPTMLTYGHPIVVVDPQFEIFEAMKRPREIMGFKPCVIEKNNGINIITLMRPYFEQSDTAYVHLADTLSSPRKENTSDAGDFFTQGAADLFSGLLKYFVEDGSLSVFKDIYEFISQDEKLFKEALKGLLIGIYKMTEADGIERKFIATKLQSFTEMDSRTFSNLQMTAKQALNWATFDELRDMVEMRDYKQPDIFAKTTDVYIRCSLENIKLYPALIRQIISVFIYVTNQERADIERLLIIDEAYQIGKMKGFEQIRDTMRKRGLHLMQIFQSPGQLEELYGAPGVRSWYNSIAARIYATPGDFKDCEAISADIGEYTVDIEGSSTSKSSKGMSSTTLGRTTTTSLQKARLLRPEQLRSFPNDGLIVFIKGHNPILCGKALSFRRKEWQEFTPFLGDKGKANTSTTQAPKTTHSSNAKPPHMLTREDRKALSLELNEKLRAINK